MVKRRTDDIRVIILGGGGRVNYSLMVKKRTDDIRVIMLGGVRVNYCLMVKRRTDYIRVIMLGGVRVNYCLMVKRRTDYIRVIMLGGGCGSSYLRGGPFDTWGRAIVFLHDQTVFFFDSQLKCTIFSDFFRIKQTFSQQSNTK